jgi:LmbE family N-acetylglucosaminyl deacetylase
MVWIYISPHFDDIALSCGGLVWEQTQAGQSASIWTICAGDPPQGALSSFAQSLHERWGTGREAIAQRREEDIHSCSLLGASYRHFDIPDCIYRQGKPCSESSYGPADFLYASEQAIFGPIHSEENSLIEALGHELAETLPQGCQVACPLALGNHVDHCLVRAAVERLAGAIWYYADYPYVLRCAQEVAELANAGWQSTLFQISAQGLLAWEESIAAHSSQISTFWPDLAAMRAAIGAYLAQTGGVLLWKPPEKSA